MEDILFERDYTKREKPDKNDRAEQIFNQVIAGGFFKNYADAMNQIPKIIIPQDKANYEYLLDRLNTYAEFRRGRIKGIVDYHKWEARIEVFLPFLGFESPEELTFMAEIAQKAHAVTVSAHGGGIRLYVFINYFEEIMTEEQQGFLRLDAIMQDGKLASMLKEDHRLSDEEQAIMDRLRAVLERFEVEKGYDRTTVLQAVLDKVMKEDEENHTLEHITAITEALLELSLNEPENEEQMEDLS